MELSDLKLKKPKYNNQIEVVLRGDENDGDMLDATTIINIDEFADLIPILKKILKKNGHNWEDMEDYLSEEEIEALDVLEHPHGADNPIHTLYSAKAYFLKREDSVRYEIIY